MERKLNGQVDVRDLVVASLITFLMGATLAGVVLIGSNIPLKCFEGGNIADWLAAAGAWVIGVVAAKIAYDANARREEDAASERSRLAEARRAHLLLLASEARLGGVFDTQLTAMTANGGAGISLPRLRMLLQSGIKKFATIRWDEKQKTQLGLSEGALQALVSTEHGFLSTGDAAERFLQKYPADDTPFEWQSCEVFAGLRLLAYELSLDSKSLQNEVEKLLGRHP